MRWTSSLSSKLTTGSPRLTSHQNWPLSKDDLLPLQVTERLGERLQNINLWKFELEKVFKLVLILKRQFFNDLGSQTTRDITAEIELLMVEKRRLEYGIQVIWQSWYSLSFWKSRKIWDVLFWISYHFILWNQTNKCPLYLLSLPYNQATEGPLHIARDCLSNRQRRIDYDLVQVFCSKKYFFLCLVNWTLILEPHIHDIKRGSGDARIFLSTMERF